MLWSNQCRKSDFGWGEVTEGEPTELCAIGLGSRTKSNAIAQANMDCVQLFGE